MSMEYLSDAWEVLINNYGENEAKKELERIISKLEDMKKEFDDAHETHKSLMMEEVIYTLRGF